MAQRICEPPGSKRYGILSVLTQLYYHTEASFYRKTRVFNPPPKVDSGVIALRRKENYRIDCNEELLFKIVKLSFQQRRKTLRNSLKTLGLPKNITEDSIFDQTARKTLGRRLYCANQKNRSWRTFNFDGEYIGAIKELIQSNKNKKLKKQLHELHYADIAELIEALSIEDAIYLVKLLDSEKTADALAEVDEDFREKILDQLSPKKSPKR